MRAVISTLLLCANAFAAVPNPPCGNWETMEIKIADYEKFVTELKRAVDANDSEAISKLIEYPPRVNVAKGKKLNIKNAADFKKNFSQIFTQAFREKLSKACHDIAICKHGSHIGLGSGYVWITETKAGLKIITINAAETLR